MDKAAPANHKRRTIGVGIAAAIIIGIFGFLFSRIRIADFKITISYVFPAIFVLVFAVYAFQSALRTYQV